MTVSSLNSLSNYIIDCGASCQSCLEARNDEACTSCTNNLYVNGSIMGGCIQQSQCPARTFADTTLKKCISKSILDQIHHKYNYINIAWYQYKQINDVNNNRREKRETEALHELCSFLPYLSSYVKLNIGIGQFYKDTFIEYFQQLSNLEKEHLVKDEK